MASGDVVGIITSVSFPATLSAVPDVIVGASTPAESIPVYDFDDATIWYLDFHGSLHGYDAVTGLTVLLRYAAAAATGNVVWTTSFRSVSDDDVDLDTTAFTYTTNEQTVTSTVPTVVGEVDYTSIAHTDGAQMDSLQDTESFILRVRRNATSGSDTLSGDAMLLDVIITET